MKMGEISLKMDHIDLACNLNSAKSVLDCDH